MVVYLNHEFVPEKEASLHISDLAIQRGYGIFEFFKVRKGVALFLDDYLDRFYRSASVMQLNVPLEREALKSVVGELLHMNKASDCGIKFILTGGYSPDAYAIGKPNFFISQYPLVLKDNLADGIKVISHEHVREIPEVKSINYITGINTLKRMNEQAAADVLYHKQGIVSEFPRCNVFIVDKEGVVKTPDKNILEGITRKNVLKLSKKKFPTEVGPVLWEEVLNAREVFLTSTTKRIIPVVQIDEHLIDDGKPGEITAGLFNDLVALEEIEISRN